MQCILVHVATARTAVWARQLRKLSFLCQYGTNWGIYCFNWLQLSSTMIGHPHEQWWSSPLRTEACQHLNFDLILGLWPLSWVSPLSVCVCSSISSSLHMAGALLRTELSAELSASSLNLQDILIHSVFLPPEHWQGAHTVHSTTEQHYGYSSHPGACCSLKN